MKLKTNFSFNAKLARQKLLEEDNFISDIFSKMPLPANEVVAQNGHEEFTNGFTKKKENNFSGEKATRAKNYEELHAKLNELRGKQLTYKDKMLKKGLKNRITKKTKREERAMRKKLARTERMSAEATKVKKEETDVPKAPKQKPIFNSQGNMVFSKFDFSEIGAKKKAAKVEKDPKKILGLLEERKQKLRELEDAGDTEKALEIKEKDAWRSALAKATGEKVKDDPELLKKTIKKREQLKKRSSKKWEARKEKVESALEQRQQKRTENIMKRKKDVKNNKLKKAAKKGRIIPGF